MKNNTYKCGYKYCKHNGEVIKEQGIKDGTRYYHYDCLKERDDKKQILDLYRKHYKSTEMPTVIIGAITNIINAKGFGSEYVLYALCQAIKSKTQMKSIYALHYIVSNSDIKKSYDKMKAIAKVRDANFDNVEVAETHTNTYIQKAKTLWTDTLFIK